MNSGINASLGVVSKDCSRQIDYGTPAVASNVNISVEIDNQLVVVPEGTSVLRAALLTGISVPKLCATDSVEPFGSCRLCLVEVVGRKGFAASCTTPCEKGMRIRTDSEALSRIRRGVMELYISDHPLDCLTCAANGDCELQDMAAAVGLREVRFPEIGNTHLSLTKDDSNPYFTFDPAKCILCSRCVRACDEIQGSFVLTIANRGFDSKVTPGIDSTFFASDCVSCGACVQACPTATLREKSVINNGVPAKKTITTCAYCGVGCSFEVQSTAEKIIRMLPNKNGQANHGHSCVKGRFAWGYATHPDRVLSPMIRENISEPWREVEWDVAFAFAAQKLQSIQVKYGRRSVGAITSSRCTNEETYLVQKLVRAVFGNNNVDTCARVCHSPTGYGLKQTLGESAGTQNFDSVMHSDVIMIIGANPVNAHPVFASQIKKRVRQGARLIIVDPRVTDLVKSPHIQADFHLQLRPGTNVALMSAIAHVIINERLWNDAFVKARCDYDTFQTWIESYSTSETSPESLAPVCGVSPSEIRAVARLYATGGSAAIYYGLGVTEHSQGSTMVMAIANLAMATGNLGREGVGVIPLRGQNNVQGACDMGSFPHEYPGYRHVSDVSTRNLFERKWGVQLDSEPGLRIPNMFEAALDGSFFGLYCQGEDIVQSDPNTNHVITALKKMECVIVQDIFLNETAQYAHIFLPGASFLEKDGTFTNAERRISRVRQVIQPRAGKADWEVTQCLAQALGYSMNYDSPADVMNEISELTPSFSGVSYHKLDEVGSIQWPCNDANPNGTPIMHIDSFPNGRGRFFVTRYIPTDERSSIDYPLLLTTGRILSQYNVGAQTRRTQNNVWYPEDVLEINPIDAEERGINCGDEVYLASRVGVTHLKARVTDNLQPGVVYTTFHFPKTGANVVTTEESDWATNCPEYKVTAVQVRLKTKISSLA